MYALVWCILLLFGITNGLIYNRVIFRPRLRKLLSTLDVGDFQNVVFTKTDHIGKYNDIGKYMLDATVTASEMNSFLDEYKEEMMDRKVIFPGFRPGKIPPSAMIDIRKYLVSHCIETIIGQLCNINRLVLCDEEGNDVQFPEDSYLEQITLNKDGKTFAEKRNMWKEGKVFEFRSEFYAKEEQEQSTEPTRSPLAEENVIDVESIEPMLVTDDGTK